MGKPENKGGLGVLDMKTQNQAHLLKYLENNYYKKDVQWRNLIWPSKYQNSIPHALVAHFGGRQVKLPPISSREVVHFHHLTQSTHSDLDPS